MRRCHVKALSSSRNSAALQAIAKGVEIDGVKYGPVEAKIDKTQGDNQWLTIAIREGKNREVKKICEYLGLKVNRLIRVSFGPFLLGEMARGAIEEVPPKNMKAQIGAGFFKESDADRRRKVQKP